jgi:hypothetical protein
MAGTADTWQVVAPYTAYTTTPPKLMLDVFSAPGATRVHRLLRAYHFNNGLSAIAGILVTMRIARTTSIQGGDSLVPIAHDAGTAALPATLSAGTGRVGTVTSVFRQYLFSNDEPANVNTAAATIDEWEVFIPFSEVWACGYRDTNVQPLTFRAGQGYCIQQSAGAGPALSSADFEMEFTNEAV